MSDKSPEESSDYPYRETILKEAIRNAMNGGGVFFRAQLRLGSPRRFSLTSKPFITHLSAALPNAERTKKQDPYMKWDPVFLLVCVVCLCSLGAAI